MGHRQLQLAVPRKCPGSPQSGLQHATPSTLPDSGRSVSPLRAHEEPFQTTLARAARPLLLPCGPPAACAPAAASLNLPTNDTQTR